MSDNARIVLIILIAALSLCFIHWVDRDKSGDSKEDVEKHFNDIDL